MSVSSVSATQALNALHLLSSDMDKLRAAPLSQQNLSDVAHDTAAVAASPDAMGDRLARRAAAEQDGVQNHAALQSDAIDQVKTLATYLADHPDDPALRTGATEFGRQLKQMLDSESGAAKQVEAQVGYGTPQPGENGSLDQTPLQQIAMNQSVSIANLQNGAYGAVGALNLDQYAVTDHSKFDDQANHFIEQLKADGDKAKLAQTQPELQAAEAGFKEAQSALKKMDQQLQTDEGYVGERDSLGAGPTKSAANDQGSWLHNEKMKVEQALILDTDSFPSASGT